MLSTASSPSTRLGSYFALILATENFSDVFALMFWARSYSDTASSCHDS